MKTATLIFPHQLLENHPSLHTDAEVFIVEEYLFFRQYNFHKQKIFFHRASMKAFAEVLLAKGYEVKYIDSQEEISDTRKLIPDLLKQGFERIFYMDTTDYYLQKRIEQHAGQISLIKSESILFVNSNTENTDFFKAKKKMFQTEFYIYQRKKLGILLVDEEKPLGGNWTYDIDNRKKYPSKKSPPSIVWPENNKFIEEAQAYVEANFKNNYGKVNTFFRYPCTAKEANTWLQQFLDTRFQDFGDFEDAIVKEEIILHHSLLSPLINVGLLTVEQVIEKSLEVFEKQNIPLNSFEGFIRQIIGWREFIRAVYELKGRQERTTNFWGFTRKIPESFWKGTTGIEPIDSTIKKVLETGYCHHIERLMLLGNFMLLCEFDPDEVYRWFMEMFIDAYDWVMVPNVYGMSQFADGGLMSTKPYISGSNYVIKMSDYKKGPWQETWDALFWRFMHVHRVEMKKNPRLNMLVSAFDKMDDSKKQKLLGESERFLKALGIEKS